MTKTLFLPAIALLIAVIAIVDQCRNDGKISDLEARINRADTVNVFDTGTTSHPVTIYQYSAVHDAKTKRKCSISGEPYTNQASTPESASWYRGQYPDAVLVHTGPGTITCDGINWNHDQ